MRIKSTTLLLIGLMFALLLSPLLSSRTLAQRGRVDPVDPEKALGRHRQQTDLCTTSAVDERKKQEIDFSMREVKRLANDQLALTGTVDIPVVFNIITRSTYPNGDVSDTQLDQQIFVMNQAYSGNYGAGANTSFRFHKAEVHRITNDVWFGMSLGNQPGLDAERAAKSALHRGDATVLNFYTCGIGGAWSSWPWDYAGNPSMDGIVVGYTRMAGSGSGYIGAHEAGHWLGLFHVFEGGCSYPNDYVDDTPPQGQTPLNTCPVNPDSCPELPGRDSPDNFMDYSAEYCQNKFTPGQSARMDDIYGQYRMAPPSASISSVAPAEFSRFGGAPNTYTVAGIASAGTGGVQLVWRDATDNGTWNTVAYQPTPALNDGQWVNSFPASNKCHEYWVYCNYSGIRSPTYFCRTMWCNESASITWIQPQFTAGFGPPGSLVVAGTARNAPSGYLVQLFYRDATNGEWWWTQQPFSAPTDANGVWYNSVPNVDFSHVYEVYVKYDVATSSTCSYQGNNQLSSCQ